MHSSAAPLILQQILTPVFHQSAPGRELNANPDHDNHSNGAPRLVAHLHRNWSDSNQRDSRNTNEDPGLDRRREPSRCAAPPPPAHLHLPQAAHDHRPTPVSRYRRQYPTHQDVQHLPAPAPPLLTRSPSRVVMIGCGGADHVSMMSSWSAFGLYSTRPRSIPAASST